MSQDHERLDVGGAFQRSMDRAMDAERQRREIAEDQLARAKARGADVLMLLTAQAAEMARVALVCDSVACDVAEIRVRVGELLRLAELRQSDPASGVRLSDVQQLGVETPDVDLGGRV